MKKTRVFAKRSAVSYVIAALLMSVVGFGAYAAPIFEKVRLGGSDRYQTAMNISKYFVHDGFNGAVLATGSDFPDALSGAVFAAKKDMPIILVEQNNIDKNVIDYLKGLPLNSVYAFGGTGVISTLVENAVAKGDYSTLYGGGISSSKDFSIRGIAIGDTEDYLIEKLGNPGRKDLSEYGFE